MAPDEQARDEDETTVIRGRDQAWSAVDQPAEIRDPGDGSHPAEDFAGPWQPLSGPDKVGGDDSGPDKVGGDDSGPNRTGGGEFEPNRTDGYQAGSDESSGSGYAGSAAPENRIAGSEPPATAVPPAPVLIATGLGMLTKGGWVFKDIDLTLRPASVAAIVGPSGTGRSCLLLALTGRMDANTGSLTVAGHSLADKPGQIRSLTSIARIGSVVGPEPGFTIRESIDERCLLDDVDTTVGRARFTEACAALGMAVDHAVLVASLIGDQLTLLAVALACVRVSAVIVLDDLDRGVSAATQQALLNALIRLAKTGPTIILSTTDRIPVMDADVVLDLTPADGATVWHFEPAAAPSGIILRQLDPADDDVEQWAAPQLAAGLDPSTPTPPPETIDQDELGPDQTGHAPTEDPR